MAREEAGPRTLAASALEPDHEPTGRQGLQLVDQLTKDETALRGLHWKVMPHCKVWRLLKDPGGLRAAVMLQNLLIRETHLHKN